MYQSPRKSDNEVVGDVSCDGQVADSGNVNGNGWKGASELPLVSSRGGIVSASDPSSSPKDSPRWAADGVGEVAVWSGAVHGLASLTIVEELGPTDDDRATAAFPTAE